MKIRILILFCLLSSITFSQQLSIDETLDYIANIENKYTDRIGFVGGDESTQRNKFSFDRNDGILTKTTYSIKGNEKTTIEIESVHISDLSSEVDYSEKVMRLKCLNENCIELTKWPYDWNTKAYEKKPYRKYTNELTLWIVQEYNAKKALSAFKYLFSLFDELKLERDKGDPFAQITKADKVSFKNSNTGTIQLQERNGTFQIPVEIGGISEKFVLDSGASDTTISSTLEAQLIRNGTIIKENYLSNALYRIADGSIISQRRFFLKNLKVGNFTVKKIIISVGGDNSPLLLGKNFLDRFETWIIDNSKKTIELKA